MLELAGRKAGIEQAGAAACLLVRDRDIAGLAWTERQRNAANVGLHRVFRARLGLDRKVSHTVHAREKAVELIESRDGLIPAPIDRKLLRRLLARCGQRNGRALE